MNDHDSRNPNSNDDREQSKVGNPYEELMRASKPYEPGELSDIGFDSFRFSQGDPFLQADVIRYVLACERDRVEPEAVEASYEALEKRTAKFIQNSAVHFVDETRGTAPKDHREMVDNLKEMWQEALAEPESVDSSRSAIVSELVTGIAINDYGSLALSEDRPEGGRGRGSLSGEEEVRSATPASRFLSQFVYYGLLGRSTRQPIYDQMFRDVVDAAPGYWLSSVEAGERGEVADEESDSIGGLIRGAAIIHFQHYPDDFEELSPMWRRQLQLESWPPEHEPAS